MNEWLALRRHPPRPDCAKTPPFARSCEPNWHNGDKMPRRTIPEEFITSRKKLAGSTGLYFSPNGKLLVAECQDESTRIYEIGDLGGERNGR